MKMIDSDYCWPMDETSSVPYASTPPSPKQHKQTKAMTYCKISLKTVPKASKYRDYQDAAFKSLFDSLKVNPVLELSRTAFKQASVRHTTGLSISGVQQKLSLRITESHQLEPVTTNGRYILKPSPEEFPNAAENEHTAITHCNVNGSPPRDSYR